MKFACIDHIDNAIDDYIDYQEIAPEVSYVHDWQNADGTQLKTHCEYCNEPATYVLTHQTESTDTEA